MAPQIIDLTVASPPASPLHPHRPNNSSSTSATASDSSFPAAEVPDYPPPHRGGRAKSNFCYKRFIRTDEVQQQSLTVRPTPMTAGPSRVRHDSNVHRYSAGALTILQQARESHLPVSDAWRIQMDPDQIVKGFSETGRVNLKSGMGDWNVKKTMSPEQIRHYSADNFTQVRSPSTRYIQKEPTLLAHPSDMNDPRAKNPASRNLRRRLMNSNPRSNNKVRYESSGGPGLLMRGSKPAPGQMVPVSALIPIFAAQAAASVSVSVPDTVSLQSSWRKPPSMFMRGFPAEGPAVLPCAEIESSCSSSGSVDPGYGEAEVDKDVINLELTLG